LNNLKSVSLVSWAYNEESLIEGFVQKALRLLRKTGRKFEIVIVNDGSTDRTGTLLKKIAKRNKQVKVLTNKTNRNVGYSCRRGILAAKNEIVFWQTIDWSYDISKLQNLLFLKEKYDVVAGVRRRPVLVKGRLARIVLAIYRLFHIKHLTKRSDTPMKALISVCNYVLIRSLFGLELSDYQNIVFYPRTFIQKAKAISNSSFVNPELLLRAHYQGLSICEAPISFKARQKGMAKGTKPMSILRSLRDILNFWIQLYLLKKVSRKLRGLIHRI
jgi:glycosyltransferase involved in cell wall biosynthesis